MGKKNFVLDTNVLLHDHKCIFNFEENDIFIPIVVLEELDNSKKEMKKSITMPGNLPANSTNTPIKIFLRTELSWGRTWGDCLSSLIVH